MNISNFLLRSVVALGLVVGFLSISLSVPFIPVAEEGETLQVDQSADDDQQSEVVLKAFDAITSSVQINLNQEFFLIDVLPELEELSEETGNAQESVLAGNKVLKVLFRRIISPNAP